MTNVLKKADEGLGRAYSFVSGTKKRAIFTGLMIYTAMFAANMFLFILPTIADMGNLLASDALAQYYPFLLDFRNNLLTLFSNISEGNFAYPLVNFNYSFGANSISTCMDFLPFLPYYIFVAAVPVEAVPLFYSVGTILLAYISGITFFIMCLYFERDPIISGGFSLFYVFCLNAFYTALFNQHFLYMYIVFPLLIMGIDRIITKKGIMLFILSSAWLALGGVAFIVYTIPFVVLFALFRVHFVYKEHYFKNLGIYFAKGCGAFFIGLGIVGILLLPVVIGLFSGTRSAEVMRLSIFEMLIPDTGYLASYLVNWTGSGTGICTAVLPLILFFIVSKKSSSEYRTYLIVSMILVMMPVIYYGLNGFQYSICRWGFIPSALLCYIGISTVQKLSETDKKQAVMFTVTGLIYLLLVILSYYRAAAVFISVVCVINAISPVRKLCEKLLGKIGALYKAHKAVRLSVPFIGFALFMLVLYRIMANGFILPAVFITAFVSAIVIVWLYYKFGYKRITSALMSVVVLVVTYMYLDGEVYVIAPMSDETVDMAKLSAVLNENKPADSFGRVSIYSNYDRISTLEEEEEEDYFTQGTSVDEKTSDMGTQYVRNEMAEYYDSLNKLGTKPYRLYLDPDQQVNTSLRYNGIADTYIFQSVINNWYVNLMKRCGIDCTSVFSQVNMNGFADNAALDSLFGVNYFCYTKPYEYAFGRDELTRMDFIGNKDMVIYKNRYAYPVGVTYSDVIGADEFYSFDAATLPAAMMNTVYLDGSPLSANAPVSGKNYAQRCDITHERVSRGTTSYGIECFDNTVTINDDVKDCLLFMSFEGVRISASFVYETLSVRTTIDGERVMTGLCQNPNDRWDWITLNDHYTFPLGFCEKDVNTLEFITPFEYKELYITAIPISEFEAAYEKCTAETLRNVELSTNTLTGDITVSEDKVLSVNILYEDSWKAYVDGVEAPLYRANDIFLGIPLEKGTHSVRLVYMYPYWQAGCTVSLISIVITVVIGIFSARARTKEKTAG